MAGSRRMPLVAEEHRHLVRPFRPCPLQRCKSVVTSGRQEPEGCAVTRGYLWAKLIGPASFTRGREMPTVEADRLTRIGVALLRAAGASQEEADAVAVGCVNANLAGHDSHGIIAVPTYIDRIKAGHIVPGAPLDDRAGVAGDDGHRWPLGLRLPRQCQGDAARRSTRRKRRTSPPAPCFARAMSAGSPPIRLMAMKEGMIGLATADSGRSPKVVAPFGGREARLGTNPISIAVPSDLEAPSISTWRRRRWRPAR